MLSTDYYPTATEAESLVVAHYNHQPIPWSGGPAPNVMELLRFKEELRGTRILDVGCGHGVHTPACTELKLEYFGIDISAVTVKEARRLNPGKRFEVMSFRNMRFDTGHFHGLWCCHSFVNTPRQYMPEVLGELRRVLAPDGVLAIVMPHHRSDGPERFSEIEEVHALTGGELWCWTPSPKSLVRLCEDAGFETLRFDHSDRGHTYYTFT